MGVQGLAAFIRQFPSLANQETWQPTTEVNENSSPDRWIIDGNAFVHFYANQHHEYWFYGGEYANVADHLRRDIMTLQKAGLQLTFLFDGALPADKEGTRLKRLRDSLGRVSTLYDGKLSKGHSLSELYVIPPLMLDVCRQTIAELGVPHHTCQGEADAHVMRLAHDYHGYCVSRDSDIHVCPRVGKGYIPLGTLKIEPEQDNKVHALVYQPEQLANLLQIDVNVLSLFGTLLGNDYVDPVRRPIEQWCTAHGVQCNNKARMWPKHVGLFLNRISENTALESLIGEVVSSLGIQDQQIEIRESIRRYDPFSPLLGHQQGDIDLKQDVLAGVVGRSVSDILESKTFWTPVFIEDLRESSSWSISLPLRKCIYGLLVSGCDVVEYARERRHIARFLEEGTELPSGTSPKAILYGAHHTDPDSLQADHHVVPLILCLRYIVHQSAADENPMKRYELIGLIAGSLGSLAPVLGLQFQEREQSSNFWTKKRIPHLTAQFQSVVFCSHMLAQVLKIPHFAETPGFLAHMYSGKIMYRCLRGAQQLRGGIQSIVQQLVPQEARPLFTTIYEAVIQDLDTCLE
ncbi:PIN domain-like protein [Syncephalastrum racemosum]|uniref:PIN domain-like protein n=1 Tax=Syncephalastrum racemosum TaxID=13706 RepID=A0A1X2H2V8_SYNRA|nr:PIN domain-like protein [Syncephalastrum racemosum]